MSGDQLLLPGAAAWPEHWRIVEIDLENPVYKGPEFDDLRRLLSMLDDVKQIREAAGDFP